MDEMVIKCYFCLVIFMPSLEVEVLLGMNVNAMMRERGGGKGTFFNGMLREAWRKLKSGCPRGKASAL